MQNVDRPKALKPLMEAATALNNPILQKAKRKRQESRRFLYQETPLEIITAAGAVPYFIRGTGSDGTEYADAFFRNLACNYVRHTHKLKSWMTNSTSLTESFITAATMLAVFMITG